MAIDLYFTGYINILGKWRAVYAYICMLHMNNDDDI